MKKLTLGFMAFALAATTLFSTSCKDDDDDDNSNQLASIFATVGSSDFEATAVAKKSETSEATGTTISIAKLLSESSTRTTIYGLNKAKQFMSVTFNGSTEGSYSFGVDAATSGTQLLIDYLTNGDLKSTLEDAINVDHDCFIIYKASSDANDASSSDFYVSTKATVKVNGYMELGSIKYVTGTFTATLMNKDKQTIEINNGTFSCPGI
ncbi:MAG: hypothetical protein MJ211_06500 [Bacteroidales bacterium]|nr:hypothetical protein [Bacteroidales bacterium]